MREQIGMLELIRIALWGEKATIHNVDWDEYAEMRKHAIAAIPALVLPKLSICPELQEVWKKSILQQVASYAYYKHEQINLPITVPYVILKGMAAAKYYPHPEYRAMGDIDIMTKTKDYQAACSMLLDNGYREITSESEATFGRHRSFRKNSIVVEVHVRFALLRNSKKEKKLDDIITQNINESHYLPDIINGLVLLDHINQHLAVGLGLRQIIDWMMYADKCLYDGQWPEFKALAKEIGLETLAVTVTEMCVMFLGLPKRDWCANADRALCQELMDYILSCGNFGNKKRGAENIGVGVFAYARSIFTSFRLLNMRGVVNWKAAKKHIWLRPFAGFYQLFRYLHRGLGRDEALVKLRNEFHTAKKKNKLLDKLGVRRISD